jgi:glycogen debranching enzyme
LPVRSRFCLSDRAGDIPPDQPQGLFFRDTRILSGWQLRLDDEGIEPLMVLSDDAYCATFLGRARPRPGQVESTLFVERKRFVGAGMREDIVLQNYGRESAGCTLSLLAEADFADLFEVKQGRVRHRGHHSAVRRAEDDENRLACLCAEGYQALLAVNRGDLAVADSLAGDAESAVGQTLSESHFVAYSRL